ncbi:hypothetical protein D3C79_885780 [compost metagenome]
MAVNWVCRPTGTIPSIGCRLSRVMVAWLTSTRSVASSGAPLRVPLAMISALPAVSPVTTPAGSTLATVGAVLLQLRAS